jgi:hypothetical protein
VNAVRNEVFKKCRVGQINIPLLAGGDVGAAIGSKRKRKAIVAKKSKKGKGSAKNKNKKKKKNAGDDDVDMSASSDDDDDDSDDDDDDEEEDYSDRVVDFDQLKRNRDVTDGQRFEEVRSITLFSFFLLSFPFLS